MTFTTDMTEAQRIRAAIAAKDAAKTIAALQAGVEWVGTLRVGQLFTGALPEANSRYKDARSKHAFVTGATATLDEISLWTDMDGIITRIAAC